MKKIIAFFRTLIFYEEVKSFFRFLYRYKKLFYYTANF